MHDSLELWGMIVPAEGFHTWQDRMLVRFGAKLFYDIEATSGFYKVKLLVRKTDDDWFLKDICQKTIDHFNIQFVNTYRISDKAYVIYDEIESGW